MNISEYLLDAVRQNHYNPDTFELPTDDEIAALAPGYYAKVSANVELARGVNGERFWVKVISIDDNIIVGSVANNLLGNLPFDFGDEVEFSTRNVLDTGKPNTPTI